MSRLMNFIKEGKQGAEQDNYYGYFLVLVYFSDQLLNMLLSAVD